MAVNPGGARLAVMSASCRWRVPHPSVCECIMWQRIREAMLHRIMARKLRRKTDKKNKKP